MTTAPRRFLGLDLGNSTGWALSEDNKVIGSGVRDFSGENKGRKGIKLYNFLQSIGYVEAVFYETVMFTPGFKDKTTGKWKGAASGDGHALYNGLLMVVEMFAAGYLIPAIGIHNGTVKKAFCGDGHGNATKEEMCEKAHSLGWMGGQPGTALCHDEADACAVLITQLRLRGLDVSF